MHILVAAIIVVILGVVAVYVVAVVGAGFFRAVKGDSQPCDRHCITVEHDGERVTISCKNDELRGELKKVVIKTIEKYARNTRK